MAKRRITRSQAIRWIKASTRILAVTFQKRTNGQMRHMVLKRKVTKHLKGGSLSFDPNAKRLIIVFDMQKGAYRCLPYEGLRSMVYEGKFYEIK